MKNINCKLESEHQQVQLLLRVVALFWFATKIWSFKTWIPDRFYPVVPVFDFFNHIPFIFHYLLFAASLIILLIFSFYKRNRRLMIFFLAIEISSCMLDTIRWQPWEYMYLCIFIIYFINFHKQKNIIALMHLFLISMYLFSGLHKLNRGFLSSFWMDMVLVQYLGFSFTAILKYKLFFAGLIIPFLEIVFAALLAFSKNKKRISYFLMLIHLTILVIIGPFGLDYNSVVWFWNIALICILLIIYNKPFRIDITSFSVRNFYWLVLWFLMPVLSFFGKWYQYFSFNLYSGKGDKMYVCFSSKDKIQPEFGEITGDKDVQCINLQKWAMNEIKSVPIPEMEIYLKIRDQLKKKYGKKNVKIMLYNPENKNVTEL